MDVGESGTGSANSAQCPVAATLLGLAAAVDALVAREFAELSEPQLVHALDAVERQTRRLPSVRDALVAQVQRREVASSRGFRSTAAWLQSRFLIGRGEARTWLRGAERLTTRVSLTGEPLAPVLPAVAAARAAGDLSTEQTKVIDDLDDELPADLSPAIRCDVEQAMVSYAAQFDPTKLTRLGQRLLDALDPDGTEPRTVEAHRRRGITIGPLRRGLARISGHVDAWTREAILSVLASLADPDPTLSPDAPAAGDRGTGRGDAAGSVTVDVTHPHGPPGVPEDEADAPPGERRLDAGRRTHPQRLHDALRELCERQLAGGRLPRRGGTAATILLTVPLATLERRTGYVSTAHGGDVPMREVIRRAGDATIVPIVLDSFGNPLYVGRRQRLANRQQRQALHVRDGGCVVPGCTTPSQDCQTHHLRDWADGGRTDLNNLTLLCSYHHQRIRHFSLQLQNGRVWCTAAPDMGRRAGPQLNTYFRGPPAESLFEVASNGARAAASTGEGTSGGTGEWRGRSTTTAALR